MATYRNIRGQAFVSDKMIKGEWYIKNTKLWCGKYSGFGIDYELFQNEVLGKGKKGIIFVCKNDLKDYRNGKIMCEAGEYRISVESVQEDGTRDTLNSKFGEQLFIPAHLCEQVG